ncbi:MAG: YeeE/YedE family protein [Chloroflexi bacterium]|nr:YeeE/YedE family protein [Chloroflexota bacterium]
MKRITPLVVGMFFGIVLVKSEVISWWRIQAMFRFQEAHMYLVIGSAVVVGAISLLIIKRFNITPIGETELHIRTKSFNKGTVIGGIMFGMGWAITGACPGPIYAQIGSGAYMAFVTFLFALVGAYLYGYLQPKLPH